MNGSWIRYVHTVDIYTKTVTENAAGQKFPTWVYSDTVPCFYVPISSRERQSPTYENRNRDQFYIPAYDNTGKLLNITYDMRLKNVKDRRGYILRGDSTDASLGESSEYYDIYSILKHTGWGGKLRFYQIVGLTAVEP